MSGTVTNQGRFYDRFDAVVLLSAPADVLLDRTGERTTNEYGKSPAERELILAHVLERVGGVVERLVEIGRAR